MQKLNLAGASLLIAISGTCGAYAGEDTNNGRSPLVLKPAALKVTTQNKKSPRSLIVAGLRTHNSHKRFQRHSATGPHHSAASFRALIARHASDNHVPFALANAVVKVESTYNPRAISSGNYGLMQIRPQTARGLGYQGSPSGLLDPDTNLRFGMKYLALAYRRAGGDTCRALMGYQSGVFATRMSNANRLYCHKARVAMAEI